MAQQSKLFDIFQLMASYYGPLNWWPAETDFEVCIGAILTQNTAWSNVEKAISLLKGADMLNQDRLMQIDLNELARLIRPSGFFNIKSVRIKSFVQWLDSRFNGSLDKMFAGDWLELRSELLKVKGVGPETCDAILLYAGRKPSFVVDSYTKRLFHRLSQLDGKESYEETRIMFMNSLPADVGVYNEYHAVIVEHCKRFCRKKPVCNNCPIRSVCCFVGS